MLKTICGFLVAFLLGFSPAHAESNYSIVFIHIGNQIPHYVEDALSKQDFSTKIAM